VLKLSLKDLAPSDIRKLKKRKIKNYSKFSDMSDWTNINVFRIDGAYHLSLKKTFLLLKSGLCSRI
jgi:predicted membrane protein